MADKRFDPYERPPSSIRDVYKLYQRLSRSSLDADPDVLDFSRDTDPSKTHAVVKCREVSHAAVIAACRQLRPEDPLSTGIPYSDLSVYEARDIPGKPILMKKYNSASLDLYQACN